MLNGKGAAMATIERKASNEDRFSPRPTLRSLYDAARREVMADPAAALRKYQPTWLLASPAASPRPAVHAVRRPAR